MSAKRKPAADSKPAKKAAKVALPKGVSFVVSEEFAESVREMDLDQLKAYATRRLNREEPSELRFELKAGRMLITAVKGGKTWTIHEGYAAEFTPVPGSFARVVMRKLGDRVEEVNSHYTD